jgi:hypothetical protein
LRSRLSPGLPLSRDGWPEIRCGTGVVKGGDGESQPPGLETAWSYEGIFGVGVWASVGVVRLADLAAGSFGVGKELADSRD